MAPDHPLDPAGAQGGARRGALHLFHRLEVRHRRVRLADGMHQRELAGLPQRHQRCECPVQPEHLVQLDQLGRRDPDVGAVRRVVRVARRHDGGQPVEATAEADHDEHVAAIAGIGKAELGGAQRPEPVDHAERCQPGGAAEEAAPAQA